MGRGFHGTTKEVDGGSDGSISSQKESPKAESYLSVMSEPKTLILCLTGFFFQ